MTGIASLDEDDELSFQGAAEGDGYHHSGGLQWSLLCPHMGAADKILYGVLCSLLNPMNPGDVRKLTLRELCRMIPSAPVDVGSAPKMATAATIRRQLDRLTALGQVTDPAGARLTSSSRVHASLRIRIFRYPRHACACDRNVRDALSVARDQPPYYPNVDGSRGPGSEVSQSDEAQESAGSKMSHASNPGSEVSQSGSEVSQSGSFLSADLPADQGVYGSPSASPLSSTSAARARGTNGLDQNEATEGKQGTRERSDQDPEDVVDNFCQQHRERGSRPSDDSVRRVREHAIRILRDDPSPQMRRHLVELARDLAQRGWSHLDRHLECNPLHPVTGSGDSQLAPWCGDCGDPNVFQAGAHPETHPSLRMTGEDQVTPCRECHPRYARKR